MQYSNELFFVSMFSKRNISEKKMPVHVYYAELINKYIKDTKSMSPINCLIGLFKMN